jgi:predicted DNA-binding transcriptional regulator AlpA
MPDLIPLNRVAALVKLPRAEVITLLREGSFPLPTKGWDNRVLWHKLEVAAWKPVDNQKN